MSILVSECFIINYVAHESFNITILSYNTLISDIQGYIHVECEVLEKLLRKHFTMTT